MRILCVAVTVLFAGSGAATVARAQGVECRVVSVEGAGAQVMRGGGTVAAVAAMPLGTRDRVRTLAGGRATLACTDAMTVTLGPATVLDMGDLAGGDAGWATTLLDGIAGFVRPWFGEKRFEVRTPSAVASVRSTEWIVEVVDGATSVFVEDGAVAVAARTGGALLEPGEGIDVTADGTAGPVKTWGAARVRSARERLGYATE